MRELDLQTKKFFFQNQVTSRFKVAHVVNTKLVFRDWFSFIKNDNSNQIIQIMQNPILKFRQRSIISEKVDYLSKNLRTLTSYNYHRL